MMIVTLVARNILDHVYDGDAMKANVVHHRYQIYPTELDASPNDDDSSLDHSDTWP
jgi:hypothetical protein